MNDKLSPCPKCGERCFAFHGAAVECINENGCSYRIEGNTKPEVIAFHERLAGVCRWKKRIADVTGTNTFFVTECGETIAQNSRAKAATYCSNCGKKVEVVK